MLMSCTRLVRSGLLAGALALTLSLAGCSSDDAEPAPSATTSKQTAGTEQTTGDTGRPTREAATSGAPSGAVRSSTAKALSCRDFRALEDDGRAAAVAALGVKSNADQVATVAATVCLSRLDDKVADVVGELVPTR
ncbi:hypothetical protein BPODLACK_00060 [Gordonia sp. YY1]|nr:hypothetical protein BPODLACK_00060 [Gordonia sp. YY1]